MARDASDIDNALVAMLGSDTSLLMLMPNGAYFMEAPPHATRFVIVALIESSDEGEFRGTAYEDQLYLVKAVASSRSGGDVKSAAARIHALLENQPIGFGSPATVPDGYAWMQTNREQRVRMTEVDGDDANLLWHHRGGLYRIRLSHVPTIGSP